MEKRIGITMGDPFGIGPEILFKAWLELSDHIKERLVIYGVPHACEKIANLPDDFLKAFSSNWKDYQLRADFGDCCHEGGQLSYDFLEASLKAILAGEIAGIVNGPVSKAAVHMECPGFLGHTQYYEAALGDPKALMCFYSDEFSVCLLCHHVPMKHLSEDFFSQNIRSMIQVAESGFEKIYKRKIRMAVCGFNPHSGEQGLMSCGEDETLEEICEALKEQGMDISGPIAADTLFVPENRAEVDLIFACNHDQGLIPFKMLHFHDGFSVTLGLKVPRMTVDHGTAFSIAGKGTANYHSMKKVIEVMAATC
jgi:4-hydroxythreonine-4-phosphate dehydrogenase